ncbi:RNA methyltransferase [soil metagenome]
MELQRITSRENRRLIYARKVRDGKESGQIFIEGRRLVTEALRSDIRINDCFFAEGFEHGGLLDPIAEKGIDIWKLRDSLFRSIAATKQPQGIVLLADHPINPIKDFNLPQVSVPVFLFLNEINNPSNLGAILRSVEAAGAGGVFVSKNSADVFSPKALRASMGAAFRVRVTENADLEEVLGRARAGGLTCLAVDRLAGASYLQIDWKKRPHLLVLGSEAHGLSSSELELIGDGISIPMDNSVESLNLAVAAGIILFEAKRKGGDDAVNYLS